MSTEIVPVGPEGSPANFDLLSLRRRQGTERTRKRRAEAAAAQRALQREREAAHVKRAGGTAAEAYSLVRRALQKAEQSRETSEGSEAADFTRAITALHKAEDAIVEALHAGDSERLGLAA